MNTGVYAGIDGDYEVWCLNVDLFPTCCEHAEMFLDMFQEVESKTDENLLDYISSCYGNERIIFYKSFLLKNFYKNYFLCNNKKSNIKSIMLLLTKCYNYDLAVCVEVSKGCTTDYSKGHIYTGFYSNFNGVFDSKVINDNNSAVCYNLCQTYNKKFDDFLHFLNKCSVYFIAENKQIARQTIGDYGIKKVGGVKTPEILNKTTTKNTLKETKNKLKPWLK